MTGLIKTLLKFHDIEFNTVPSTNHASPSGALPFLLAANDPSAISSTRLASWAYAQNNKHQISSNSRRALTYHALLTGPVRLAYLHAFYLEPITFSTITAPLYVDPCSTSNLVRLSISWPLRAAALAEVTASLSGSTPRIDVEALYSDMEEAFGALNIFLGRRNWFDGHGDAESLRPDTPGELDALVFAYTHVILALLEERLPATGLGPGARRLVDAVRSQAGVVQHRDRIMDRYYR